MLFFSQLRGKWKPITFYGLLRAYLLRFKWLVYCEGKQNTSEEKESKNRKMVDGRNSRFMCFASSNYVHTKCFLFSEYIKFFKSRKSNYKGVGLNFTLIGVCLREPTWVSDRLSLRGRKLSTNKCHLNMTSTLAVEIQAPGHNKLLLTLRQICWKFEQSVTSKWNLITCLPWTSSILLLLEYK